MKEQKRTGSDQSLDILSHMNICRKHFPRALYNLDARLATLLFYGLSVASDLVSIKSMRTVCTRNMPAHDVSMYNFLNQNLIQVLILTFPKRDLI